MPNLLEIGGTLKRNIGEVIFSHVRKYSHRAIYDSYHWIEKLPFKIPQEIKKFLMNNWGTIDVFEFVVEANELKNIIFYEVKTSYSRHKTPCLTVNSLKFYNKCLKIGFKVKSVFIYFEENWNFSIVEKDFDINTYRIRDGNPRFSKKL